MTDVILHDVAIDPSKFMFKNIDTSRLPLYTVSEVAKFFFGRSPHWMRWRERKGFFVLNGKDVGTTRTEQGARVYTLTDIEQIAHALALSDPPAIDGEKFHLALHALKSQGRIWGYF